MTPRLVPLLVPLLLLVGCSREAQPTAPPSPAPTATESPAGPSNAITSAGRLTGEYRVAGVNGDDIDLPYGITASISRSRIHVVADCVNVAWNYIFQGDMLVTERAPVEGCARGLTKKEDAIVDAFDAATTVSVTEANGVEFTGDGHTVVLFAQ